MNKALVIELWGLGDAVLATAMLQALQEGDIETTVLCKSASAELLRPSYPDVHFIVYQAPWTAFRAKYRLWEWNWGKLIEVVRHLRGESFDAAFSVRFDPRDHLLMRLIGARQRFGFPRLGSGVFLTHRMRSSRGSQHRVEDWQLLQGASDVLQECGQHAPNLNGARYAGQRVAKELDGAEKPVVTIHCGAGHAIRRWPLEHFQAIMERLRSRYRAHLMLIPDTDGYGQSLSNLADTCLENLSLGELVTAIRCSSLYVGNDTGPTHIAAALSIPVIAFFGPQTPRHFGPWGDNHKVVAGGQCPHRPCRDYCRYDTARCLTELDPDQAWSDIENYMDHLIATGILPERMRGRE